MFPSWLPSATAELRGAGGVNNANALEQRIAKSLRCQPLECKAAVWKHIRWDPWNPRRIPLTIVPLPLDPESQRLLLLHKQQTVGMTALHQSAPQGLTSFAIYEDPEDQEPQSPSEMYSGDTSYHSERSQPTMDDALPSIEFEQDLEDEPEPYRSSYTSRKSDPRRSSGVTHYSLISAVPSELSVSSNPMAHADHANETRYAPRKERPRFRNPESVRAMQMSSPPPLPAYEASRERMKGSYKLATPSRSGRSETPVSKRSGGSRRGSIREHQSPRPTPTPQQAPLVLLHVTILPIKVPYSHEIMARIMPDWLVENYKLLEEKLQDIILMHRGLLIPHPRDEYDLLEERILESLELKTPRLLKCGHFVGPDEDTDREEEDDASSLPDDATGRGSRMSGSTFGENMSVMDHGSTCTDCHREFKKPGKGVGAGTRKWDIKIYAANGLMRAAAWSACFMEMERCDVEISPWIPEEIRKNLERRALEETEAGKRKQLYTIELQRQIQEAAAKQKILEEETLDKKKNEEMELQKSFEAAAAALERSIEEKAAEKKKFEEILESKIKDAKDTVRLEIEARAMAESTAVAERLRVLEAALTEQIKPAPKTSDTVRSSRAANIPLSTLLKNYILVLLGDQRNVIILVLGAVVVFLAMNMNTTSIQHVAPQQLSAVPNMKVSTVAVTTTATSFSTFTVTEVQTASVVQATASPWESGSGQIEAITEHAPAEASADEIVLLDMDTDVHSELDTEISISNIHDTLNLPTSSETLKHTLHALHTSPSALEMCAANPFLSAMATSPATNS